MLSILSIRFGSGHHPIGLLGRDYLLILSIRFISVYLGAVNIMYAQSFNSID